ncbi:MAG: helix-turn-helix transcriptional regulator [Weeksellaceae bacterium]|jgi:transcriptional regulator with XRE-family HTH domain|nr:helix-turn-helix transcriptional regulator [Weeksellaceae bacterium]MDX9705709.1 helix-turn-helix transcriptional regulator [Weeksellaceae bacterium]
MELTNRILEILEKSGLTPSEFADKIEVQRSAISHITSGRNKPSLDFLLKIKSAFPEIDTDWLLFGIEKKEENEISNSSSPSLFDFSNFKKITQSGDKNSIPLTDVIKKVILFYEDGSFEEYHNRN